MRLRAASLSAFGLLSGCATDEPPIPVTSHYPRAEAVAGAEGTAVIDYFIAPSGLVTDVKLDSSSGYKGLDDAAMNMVKERWRFRPALRNGKPVGEWMKAAIHYVQKPKPEG